MKSISRSLATVVAIAMVLVSGCMMPMSPVRSTGQTDIMLPPPVTAGGMSLSEALAERRSIRAFADKPVSMKQLSQLCWAAQGITDRQHGKRTAPSALALYAINIYVVDKDGLYEYLPGPHALRPVGIPQAMDNLRATCWQTSVGVTPLCMVVTMDVERLKPRCGNKAERYSLLEAGHVTQNVLLEATALGLASVPVGGADEASVKKALDLPAAYRPVYLLPIGYPK
jgi:SagB-type dehydrogenase family enzyme